jgi:hypothetical protein
MPPPVAGMHLLFRLQPHPISYQLLRQDRCQELLGAHVLERPVHQAVLVPNAPTWVRSHLQTDHATIFTEELPCADVPFVCMHDDSVATHYIAAAFAHKSYMYCITTLKSADNPSLACTD